MWGWQKQLSHPYLSPERRQNQPMPDPARHVFFCPPNQASCDVYLILNVNSQEKIHLSKSIEHPARVVRRVQ